MIRSTFSFVLLIIFSFVCFVKSQSQPQKNYPAGEIQQALKKLNSLGSVLYIAAHPDDENTRLLSYLANEKLLRTAYLSLTRGDGGQNLIGPEQAEQLGLIRTQELLAARRIDGAEQFFTRANDFGFSKNPEETFNIWGKEKILADVVWVIRIFRPDIIITRFPTDGKGGHGHHTASAILAEEAFDAAADPNRFPEQLKYVQVWQAKTLLWNSFIRDPKADVSAFIKLDVGTYNPLLGKSYGELAAESRSMHKSQGFGAAKTRGTQLEYFKWIKGTEIKNDLFEDYDVSWKRIKGSENLSKLLQKAYEDYKPEQPELILPMLVNAYEEIGKIKDEYWKAQKRKELEAIILACAGIYMEAIVPDYSAVPGENVQITSIVVKRTNANVKLQQIIFPDKTDTLIDTDLKYNEVVSFEKNFSIPSSTYSNPYWLNQKSEKGIFKVEDQTLIGTPESEALLNAKFLFTIENKSFTYIRPITYKWVDPVNGEKYRHLELVPPVTVNIKDKVYLFPNKQNRQIQVILKSATDSISGNLKIEIPANWKIEPASIPFTLNSKGEEKSIGATVTPPQSGSEDVVLKAVVTVNNEQYSKSITRIEHAHIPVQLLLADAEAKLVPLNIQKKGTRIGYIVGADDAIPDALKDLGYEVTLLNEEMLSNTPLAEFDAIVVGIRAYNTNERMPHYYKKLMNYIHAGGNLIVQYNTNNFLSSVKTEIGPYPFKISRDRVTDEEAPVVFENPTHPILNSPNKITQQDFEGWIQERGLYFANEWDPHYETVISSNDPGEKPLKGGVLVAKYGKGHFVYTGLSFFRELPAGVPGAYRLFVNMISLGK